MTSPHKPLFSEILLRQQIDDLLPQPSTIKPLKLLVAFSGGLDSTVLLFALKQITNTEKDIFIRAVHINHQLQKGAKHWQTHCEKFCVQNTIPYSGLIVTPDTKNGKGLESAARDARYGAIKNIIQPDEYLLTAHHINDHVETVLLKLFRGTGLEGMKGIRPLSTLLGMQVCRPLLSFSRHQLKEYATACELNWIEDPSNESNEFDRNYVRKEVMPVIEKRWPAYLQTINRFTELASQQSHRLRSLTEDHFRYCFNESDNTLQIDKLRLLEAFDRTEVIRFWLKQLGYALPEKKHYSQIEAAIFAREDANPLVSWSNVCLRRYRNKFFVMTRKVFDSSTQFAWQVEKSTSLDISGVGTLYAQEKLGQGICVSALSKGVTVRFRREGDKCRPRGRKDNHSLKKLFQEAAIPPWKREEIPLIVVDGLVVCVVDYFECDEYTPTSDAPGIEFTLKPKNKS